MRLVGGGPGNEASGREPGNEPGKGRVAALTMKQ